MYTKIDELFWKDLKIKNLSDDAKLLFFYILTSHHRNIIGYYYLPIAYLISDLKWEHKKTEKSFTELMDKQFIKYDYEAEIIFIKNYLKYNPLENPNQVKSALATLDRIPQCSIDIELSMCLKQFNKPFIQPLLERLAQRYSEPVTVTVALTEDITVPITLSVEQVPYNAIRDLFNSICTSLPKVLTVSKARKDKLKLRWNEIKDLETFELLFKKVQANSFLIGNNKNGWKATFDWLIENSNNYVKVLEGQYENKADTNRQNIQEIYDWALEEDKKKG